MGAFRNRLTRVFAGCAAGGLLAAAGCTPAKQFLDERLPPPGRGPSPVAPPAPVVQAAAEAPAPAAPPTGVDDFVRLAVSANPRIARATFAVDAARGKYVQAGLYPNPDLAVNWDEIGDRSSPDRLGILTVPRVSQTIVTGRKLSLSQAVAAREVDQATLDLLGERYAVAASVRAAFYELYTLQERVEILGVLAKLAEESVATGRTLLENKQIARLDLVQLEVGLERMRAEQRAAAAEIPSSRRRLAAATGEHELPVAALAAAFEDLPSYDLDQSRAAVLASHPEARSARVGVERAQAAVRRAEVEPIPNVSVYGAYIRQYENRSRDGAVGVSVPIPVWNRNQGNIRAARAELGMAIQEVGRVENDLSARVAAAFQVYAASRERAERFRREIIPRATEAYELSLRAFRGGQFEYLRVFEAQRSVAEAKLERNRALGEAWRAAAELSGLLLEEIWPGPPVLPKPPPPPER